MATRGAKGKYSATVVKTICEAIELGQQVNRAIALVGISYETYYVWLRGKPEFAEAIKHAEAACIDRCLRRIQAASMDTWQAAAWILERRFPNEYGRTVQETTGEQRITIRYANDWRGKQEVDDAQSPDGE